MTKNGILGYDYIEFYVGSAKAVSYWFQKALGMKLVAYCGPETGVFDKTSYFLTQNELKILVTASTKSSNHEINSFVGLHGDAVKRWALRVRNVEDAYNYAIEHGGINIRNPSKVEDENGFIEEAAIKVYDDTEIVFVDYSGYNGIFRPKFIETVQQNKDKSSPELIKIDHIVGNVRVNNMKYWAEYFNKVMDFETFMKFDAGDISTKYSSLISVVVKSRDDLIKNPINEPYEGIKISQIEEFIHEYNGSGIQHIAIKTEDIIHTISTLRKNGVDFLEVPKSYYEDLVKRNESRPEKLRIQESLDSLRENQILCDFEEDGYLLQLFTKPIGDRPTFFFEFIQRNKAKGFGQGNFQALFEAIELEQDKRGNLETLEH